MSRPFAAPLPIVTVASRNYLAHARTLARSYLEFHPGGRVFVCLVDRVDGAFVPAEEPFVTVPAEELGIPRWPWFAFRYKILELNTAVKPFVLAHLFRTYGLDRLAFLDADTVLYGPLDEASVLLETHGVVLTPHLVRPVAERPVADELSQLLGGVYNTGFVGLSRRTELDALLAWWQARLYRFCLDDPSRGFYVDQRWLDLVPGLFPNVYVWRDPGCNIARWNYAERPIERRDGRFVVGDGPLRFMHYSGFRVDDPEVPSKSRGVVSLASVTPAIAALLHDYRARLIENGYETVSRLPYAYGRFDNGVPIPHVARACYREMDPEGARWPQPFATGPGSFFEFLNSPHPRGRGRPSGLVTELAAYIYRIDRSLQEHLPGGPERQPTRLAAWVATEGVSRYRLPDALAAPLRPRSARGAMRMLVRQQREIGGLSWRARVGSLVRVLGGADRVGRRFRGAGTPGSSARP